MVASQIKSRFKVYLFHKNISEEGDLSSPPKKRCRKNGPTAFVFRKNQDRQLSRWYALRIEGDSTAAQPPIATKEIRTNPAAGHCGFH